MRFLKSTELNVKNTDICIPNEMMTNFLSDTQFKFNIIIIINFVICLFLSIIIASVLRFFTTKKVSYKEDSYFNSITVDHRV
jgi:hypothetical protein